MEEALSENCPAVAEPLDLGIVLGQSQAFGLVAGRCSAAQAAIFKRLRDEKKYRDFSSRWREFCPRQLNMSSSQVDRIIRLFEEYGNGYFELRQLIRISPEAYRAVEPSIKGGALHFNGEAIQLDPENSGKVAAAVTELRRSLPAKESPEPTVLERLAALEKRCTAIISEFQSLAGQKCEGEAGRRLEIVLNWASAHLQQIEIIHGLY